MLLKLLEVLSGERLVSIVAIYQKSFNEIKSIFNQKRFLSRSNLLSSEERKLDRRCEAIMVKVWNNPEKISGENLGLT